MSNSWLGRGGSARYLLIASAAALCGFVILAITLSKSGHASFPGTNGKIAYSNGQSYVSQSIYSVNADGSSPTGLTAGANDYAPSYSADGSKIAFNRENNVVVMNSDGSGATQIATGAKSEKSSTTWQQNYIDPHSKKTIPVVKIETRNRTGQAFYDPVFTPDGTQLVASESTFNRTQESICAVEKKGDLECIGYGYGEESAYFNYNFECHDCFEHIVTISSTTGAVTSEVTPKVEDVSDFTPAVAADGKIAFARFAQSSPGQSGIFVVNSPGAPPMQLTSSYGNYSPDFSPDSSKVIFSRGEREFGIVGVGGGPIALINMPPLPEKTYEYIDNPTYSPDGTQIAFFRSVYHFPGGEEHGIFAMGSDGSNQHRIAEGYGSTWQPVPPPPPPPPPATPATSKAPKKHKIRLNKKGQAVIGTIVCGSSPCTLKVLLANLKVRVPASKGKKKGHRRRKASASKARHKAQHKGRRKSRTKKKKFRIKVSLAKALAPGAKAKVKVTVKGRALAALRKARKGVATVKTKVTEALGSNVVAHRAKLIPPKAKKHKKKGRHKKGRR